MSAVGSMSCPPARGVPVWEKPTRTEPRSRSPKPVAMPIISPCLPLIVVPFLSLDRRLSPVSSLMPHARPIIGLRRPIGNEKYRRAYRLTTPSFVTIKHKTRD